MTFRYDKSMAATDGVAIQNGEAMIVLDQNPLGRRRTKRARCHGGVVYTRVGWEGNGPDSIWIEQPDLSCRSISPRFLLARKRGALFALVVLERGDSRGKDFTLGGQARGVDTALKAGLLNHLGVRTGHVGDLQDDRVGPGAHVVDALRGHDVNVQAVVFLFPPALRVHFGPVLEDS
jgi:hypothetical protein